MVNTTAGSFMWSNCIEMRYFSKDSTFVSLLLQVRHSKFNFPISVDSCLILIFLSTIEDFFFKFDPSYIQMS